MPQLRVHDREIPGVLDIDDAADDVVMQERLRRGLDVLLDGIDVAFLAVRNPGNAEELEIPGEGRLGDIPAFLLQAGLELLLAVNLLVAQNVQYEPPSGFLTGQIRLLARTWALLYLGTVKWEAFVSYASS
jgi:hypothetical protein